MTIELTVQTRATLATVLTGGPPNRQAIAAAARALEQEPVFRTVRWRMTITTYVALFAIVAGEIEAHSGNLTPDESVGLVAALIVLFFLGRTYFVDDD